jgi:hypothetical protein
VALRSERLAELRALATKSDMDTQRLATVLGRIGAAGG